MEPRNHIGGEIDSVQGRLKEFGPREVAGGKADVLEFGLCEKGLLQRGTKKGDTFERGGRKIRISEIPLAEENIEQGRLNPFTSQEIAPFEPDPAEIASRQIKIGKGAAAENDIPEIDFIEVNIRKIHTLENDGIDR